VNHSQLMPSNRGRQPMTPIEIRVFGGFHLTRAGTPVAELPARVQALFTNTLLHRTAPRSRQQLAYTFWPESTDKQARTNLRRLLLLLRRALTQTDELFDITPAAIAWNPHIPVRVDLHCFEDGLAAALASANPRRAALDAGVDHYTGDLLPDCYDEWILPERERLRNAFAGALADLTVLAENERDYPTAIAYARRLLRHDPLHEAGYRRLMRLLALTGDRAGALQSYHTCATLLYRELGVEPGPETRQLYAQLLQQDSGATAQPERSATSSANRLVGRMAEWQALQKQWRQATPGHARWVLISGEAGMGKSRLAEEMLAWAERQGIPAAHARAYASTGNVSYGPLVDLLRNDALRAGWEKLADHWLVELSRLLPEIHSAQPHLPPPSPLAEEWQKRRLFEALAQALLADGRPRLLVLDDLQWVDTESLEFLAFLLRYPGPARLLLVSTARSEEMLDNPTLQTVIREATGLGQLTQLPLAPLTASETGKLAAQTDGASLDKDAAARLHSESGGNPLFVEEIVRFGDWRLGIGRDDKSPISNLQSLVPSLPPKIQALIEGRLAGLSPEAREIAAQAAVLGRSFTYPVLVAATTLDEAVLVDGLDELWRRQIIREVGVGGEGYDFSHDRIRDVAYGVISAARRRLLHRRAGEALLRVHAGKLGPVQGQLGSHFASAGENLAAIEHFRQAAAVALDRYAHAEASEYLTAAIVLAESEGDAAVYPLLAERERVNRAAHRMDDWAEDLDQLAQMVERMDDGNPNAIHRRANLMLARYFHEYSTGDRNHSLALVQEVVTLARACSDTAIEAEALVGFGLGLWWQGNLDAAQSALDEGYTKAMKTNLFGLAARSLEVQAQLQMFGGGRSDHILGKMAEALHLYEKSGNETGESDILNKAGYLPVAQGIGDYRQALSHLERGLTVAQRIGNKRAEMHILRNLSLLHTCLGDYRQSEKRAAQSLDLAAQMHDEPNRTIVENYRGFLLLQLGQLAEARVVQTSALRMLRKNEQRMWMVKAITALGWIAFCEGGWQAAEARATEAIAESAAFNEERQVAHSCTLRGWARLKLNRADAAIPDFQRSAEILLRLEMENRAQEPLAGLAQAAWQNGDLSAAHSQAAAVARHLLSHPLDRTTDTFLAIHTCHAILCAAGDPLAEEVCGLALAHLEYRASHIEPEHLDGFWAMPGHKEFGPSGTQAGRNKAFGSAPVE
jgi:DNA-binding SARP family transcriptional activator